MFEYCGAIFDQIVKLDRRVLFLTKVGESRYDSLLIQTPPRPSLEILLLFWPENLLVDTAPVDTIQHSGYLNFRPWRAIRYGMVRVHLARRKKENEWIVRSGLDRP